MTITVLLISFSVSWRHRRGNTCSNRPSNRSFWWRGVDISTFKFTHSPQKSCPLWVQSFQTTVDIFLRWMIYITKGYHKEKICSTCFQPGYHIIVRWCLLTCRDGVFGLEAEAQRFRLEDDWKKIGRVVSRQYDLYKKLLKQKGSYTPPPFRLCMPVHAELSLLVVPAKDPLNYMWFCVRSLCCNLKTMNSLSFRVPKSDPSKSS